MVVGFHAGCYRKVLRLSGDAMFRKLTKHGFYLATSTNASTATDRVEVDPELSSRIKHGGAVGYLAPAP